MYNYPPNCNIPKTPLAMDKNLDRAPPKHQPPNDAFSAFSPPPNNLFNPLPVRPKSQSVLSDATVAEKERRSATVPLNPPTHSVSQSPC